MVFSFLIPQLPLQVARKAKRVDIFKRAEKFAKEYQDKERDEIRWVSLGRCPGTDKAFKGYTLGPAGIIYTLVNLNVSQVATRNTLRGRV